MYIHIYIHTYIEKLHWNVFMVKILCIIMTIIKMSKCLQNGSLIYAIIYCCDRIPWKWTQSVPHLSLYGCLCVHVSVYHEILASHEKLLYHYTPYCGKTVDWTEVYLLIHERYVLFSINRNISGWSQPSAILYNSVMVCLQLAGVGYMVLKIVGGGQQKWL